MGTELKGCLENKEAFLIKCLAHSRWPICINFFESRSYVLDLGLRERTKSYCKETPVLGVGGEVQTHHSEESGQHKTWVWGARRGEGNGGLWQVHQPYASGARGEGRTLQAQAKAERAVRASWT